MDTDFDVIIVGAGTAGHVAAIQAGRAGGRVLVLEKEGICGGTMTVAGISMPGLFHAWGRQVIAGIGWELVSNTVEEAGLKMPDFENVNLPHWRKQVWVSAGVYAAIAEEAMLGAGVEILYHCMPFEVLREDGSWRVKVAAKSGVREFCSQVLVDCTGDANVVSLAGCDVCRNEQVQPATLNMRVGGYDFDSLDFSQIKANYLKAIACGEIFEGDLGWHGDDNAEIFLRCGGFNSNHLVCDGGDTSEGRTRVEIAGRQALLRILRFMKKQKGLKGFAVESFNCQCGVRETVTIDGEKRVSVDDYVSGKVWEDSVCNAFYQVDLHLSGADGIASRKLEYPVVPTVPLGALIPKGAENLLAAGRCVSSDQLANSALRVQAVCMAMGQAAGGAAVLAVKKGVECREVDIAELRNVLIEYGSILP